MSTLPCNGREAGSGHQIISFIKNKDVKLYVIVLLTYIFVFMPMFFRMGYHWDETLDFSGEATATYVGAGRWMLALLRMILGEGVHPWTASIVACMLLSLACVWQCRIFRWGSAFMDVVYSSLTAIMCQYAFVLQYSHQSDATAIGMLLITCALYIVDKHGWRMSCTAAATCIGTALAIYQSLAFYFISLLSILLILKCINNQTQSIVSTIARASGCTIIGAAIWLIGKEISLHFIDAEVVAFCTSVQGSMSNTAALLSAPVDYILHYTKCAFIHAFSQEFSMEALYSGSIIAVICITYKAFAIKTPIFAKLFMAICALGLWLSPYLLIVALGNDWMCWPRTRIAEPVSFAGLWTIVLYGASLKGGAMSASTKKWMYLLLFILLVRASACVSDKAKNERAYFETRLFRLKAMEQEAVNLANKAGYNPGTYRCILFIPDAPYEDAGMDFNSPYPALRNIPSATRLDYMKHKEALQSMPIWPQQGSVKLDKGEVIIRGEVFDGSTDD